MEKADALSLETETSSPNRVAFEAGLFAVAVVGAVGGRILEDGFSGLGVGDVGAAFAVDATTAALVAQSSHSRGLDGKLVPRIGVPKGC